MNQSKWLVSTLLVFFLNLPSYVYSQPLPVSAPPLQRQQYLMRSGVAFDASEDIFGLIHIEEPKDFFKPDTEQVSWWGEFKPFKAWGRPELEAKWYNPQGQLMAGQKFRGNVCRLAKTTLKMQGMKEVQQGLWRVEVYMKGKLLDQKQFSIYESGPSPSKSGPSFSSVSVETSYQQKEVHL